MADDNTLYRQGSVWVTAFVKVVPGMFDAYIRDLATHRKPVMDKAKAEGLVLSDKLLVGAAVNRDDWDVMIMVEYKNWAAFDRVYRGLDAIANQVIASGGSGEGFLARVASIREVVGEKSMQELHLN